MLQVEYVAADPVPEQEQARAQQEVRNAAAAVAGQYARMNVQPPRNTRELARGIVRFKNGTFDMKGVLRVMVDCTESTYPGMKSLSGYGGPGHPPRMITGPSSTMNRCMAALNYFTAPEDQFAGLVEQWNAPGMMGHPNEAWQNAWTSRSIARTQQMTAQMNQAAAAQRQAQQQQFNHQQAVRQQMHEQFLATMRAGTDRSMARTQAGMNARSRAASDWVDYALDQQTVRNPGSGQINKVSSSYRYTWANGSGQTYQTNDPNANPNGAQPGNWTKQQVVHGNGEQ
jgi:hypothetical protein